MQVPERQGAKSEEQVWQSWQPLFRNLDSSQSGRKCGATAELGKTRLLHIHTA